MNPLLNSNFIELLDKDNLREIYAKIISLTLDEYPIEEISGKVSLGSLSIDGASAVRRTCSLTIVADRVNINEYYWGFTNKFKLYIGLKMSDALRNLYRQTTRSIKDSGSEGIFINGEIVYPYEAFPDIIWFPLGVFLITDFKYNLNANSTDNIYISGKDKMCLLNGDIGGHFPHATDLKYQEEYVETSEGTPFLEKQKQELTVKLIITEMVHKYANEPLHNIIVNDLDQTGFELLDYYGENDIYFFKNVLTGLIENVVFDGEIIKYDAYNNPVLLSNLTDLQLDSLSSNYIKKSAIKVKNNKSALDRTYYTVIKCSQGAAVGYRVTDLTYPEKELIANVGDTLTSILDKLVKFLGDYEYFYNLLGQFVFLKKLVYINTSWNNLSTTLQETEATYTGYIHTRNSNIVNGMDMDDSLTTTLLEDTTYVESMKLVSLVKYKFIGGKTTTMFSNNPNIMNVRNDYIIWGKLKSNSDGLENLIHLRCAIDEKPEKYVNWDGIEYTTENWDWRELIYQMALDYMAHNHDDDYEVLLYLRNPSYKYGHTGYELYYTDLIGFWRYLYNPEPEADLAKNYYLNTTDNTKYWRKIIFTNPATLLFWFDFLDAPGSGLNKYSVKAIGDRTKAVNENDVKAIYYGEIPNVVFITREKYLELLNNNLVNSGYTYILLPEFMEKYFSISKKSKTALDTLDDLIYLHAYCNESITITTMPIYHLEPNVKISVFDEKSGINGEYIINKLSIPLGYNGTMQIMATKAPIRLY